MGDKTKIQWCDASWPIVNGCRRVSPGCEKCYAERLIATRLSQQPKYKGLAVFKESGPRWTGESRLWREHLDWPLRWKWPRKIFVADMGDLFYEGVTNEEIAAVFGVMAACPRHTFQVLTKRASRMLDWFRWVEPKVRDNNAFLYCSADDKLPVNASDIHSSACFKNAKAGRRWEWPLPNVHLGVSIEDQKRADERIPILLDTPAAVWWISAEPLLERVGLARLFPHAVGKRDDKFWVVVGGESGPEARHFDVGWARSIVEQCAEAKVPVFVKQLGAKPFQTGVGLLDDDDPDAAYVCPIRLNDKKGGDWDEWTGRLADLRVRQFPQVQP